MNSFFLQFWGAFLEDQRWILSFFQDSQLRGYEVKTAKKSIVNLYIYIYCRTFGIFRSELLFFVASQPSWVSMKNQASLSVFPYQMGPSETGCKLMEIHVALIGGFVWACRGAC